MSLFFSGNPIPVQALNIDELYYIKPSKQDVEAGTYPPALIGKLIDVTTERPVRVIFTDVKEVESTNPIQTKPWIQNGEERNDVTFVHTKNRPNAQYWYVSKRETSGLPAQQLARQKGLPPHLGQYINSFLMPDRTTATPYPPIESSKINRFLLKKNPKTPRTPAPPLEEGGSRRRYKKTNKKRRTNKRRRTHRRR
jgi:hypothetical protein